MEFIGMVSIDHAQHLLRILALAYGVKVNITFEPTCGGLIRVLAQDAEGKVEDFVPLVRNYMIRQGDEP